MIIWMQSILNDYPKFCEQVKSLENDLRAGENAVIRQNLALLSIRIGTVESWFMLLDTDEKVAVRQMLLGNDEAAAAARKAAVMWVRQLAANHRSPLILREQAIGRIAEFAGKRPEIFHAIF